MAAKVSALWKFGYRVFPFSCSLVHILQSRCGSTILCERSIVTQSRHGIHVWAENECDSEALRKVEELYISDNLLIFDDFISEEEERLLYEEVRPSLEKRRYQRDHWDDAIHGYRESEQENWSKASMMIIKRMKDAAFDSSHSLLPYVHVLDLESTGFIKPHIDSVKFCGSTIAGLSLLSPSVMRFRHDNFKNVMIDALLSRRSLYICRNAVRYEFTHEILAPEQSIWKGNHIERSRRISLMLRCKPDANGPMPTRT